MFSWFKKRRRRQLLSQPFPPEWVEHLRQNVKHFGCLPPAQQAKLQERIQVFVAEKEWVGCGGLEITDEMKVTIAGTACLLLLGFDEPYCFDGVRSILVYPGAYLHPPDRHEADGMVVEKTAVEGESWHRGPIVLSWQHVLAGAGRAADGENVVLHEFAHHLDELYGGADGVPPLGSRREYQDWHDVTSQEFERLVRQSKRGTATLLDHYGAEDKAEFFAVATEVFFEQPAEMRRRHPELYAILEKFYRQDPASWFEAPQPVRSRRKGQRRRG